MPIKLMDAQGTMANIDVDNILKAFGYTGGEWQPIDPNNPKDNLITHYRQPFCSRPKPVEQRFLPAMTLPRISIPGQAT
jgi:hypothetical protein